MTVVLGSTFTGAAGLDHAIEQRFRDTRLAWYSEYEPAAEGKPPPRDAAAKLLAYRYPDVPNLGDVTRIDWTTVERVNLMTGGFPCQDLSLAGKGAGLQRGDNRSGLWAHMAEGIDVLRPEAVVIENVRGLLSARADWSGGRGPDRDVEPCPWCLGDLDGKPALRALGAVLGDLADVGYDAAWAGLRAADVGAAHGRFRVFILAWRRDGGREWLARHAAHVER